MYPDHEHVNVRLVLVPVTPKESARIEKQLRYQARKVERQAQKAKENK
jgi:hypothetical protein